MHGGAALSPRGPFGPSARARRAARVQARTLQQHPAAARAGGGACVAAIPYPTLTECCAQLLRELASHHNPEGGFFMEV